MPPSSVRCRHDRRNVGQGTTGLVLCIVALRFVAVQAGAIERLTAVALRYLVARGRSDNP